MSASSNILNQMRIEPESSLEEVTALLTQCDLPVADISSASPVRLFGIRSGASLMAVIGLELYPPVALLRSLAVAPSFRGYGAGRELVRFAESYAAVNDVEEMYLLTTSAESFFLSLGYTPVSRSAAPEPIQATSQFSTLCPASSAFLSRKIGRTK